MVENACGNPLAKSGYACYFKQMVETWRKAWSKDGTTGLTDEMFPIGVVTLASQEGQCGGGWMRIAQSGGTGLLPTADLPNTFVAQGWDAQEPSDPSGWPTHERTCACMGFDSPYSCGEPGTSTWLNSPFPSSFTHALTTYLTSFFTFLLTNFLTYHYSYFLTYT